MIVLFLIRLVYSDIELINRLDQFRVGEYEEAEAYLSDFVLGSNLYYEITSESEEVPELYQGMELVQHLEKTSTSEYLNQEGYFFTHDSSGFDIWNISNVQNISHVASHSLGSLHSLKSIYPTDNNLVVTIQQFLLRAYIEVLNITDISDIKTVNSLSIEIGFLPSAVEYFDYNDQNILVAVASIYKVAIFNINFLENKTIYIREIASPSLHVQSLNITSVTKFADTTYVCDYSHGIFEIHLQDFLKEEDGWFKHYTHPTIFGNLNSCNANSYYMTVTTTSNVLIYLIPFFQYIRSYPLNLLGLEDPYQARSFVSNHEITAGYIIMDGHTYLRVYSNDDDICIINEAVQNLTDFSEAFPGFSILEDSNIVLTNRTSLLNFMVHPRAVMYYSGDGFKGTLTASNDEESQDFPLEFHFIESTNTTIHDFRGAYPSEGFFRSTSISEYIQEASNNQAFIYIPLSNYFTGQDVKYGLYSSDLSAEITLPEKVYWLTSLNYEDTDGPFDMKWQPSYVDSGIILLRNSRSVYVVLQQTYSQLTLPTIDFDDPEIKITATASFLTEDTLDFYVLVELLRNELLYWEVYQIYMHGDPIEVYSMPLLDKRPSGKLELYRNWIYSMNSSAIDVYQFAGGESVSIIKIGTINSQTLDRDEELELYGISADFGYLDQVYIYDMNTGIMVFNIGGLLTDYEVIGEYEGKIQAMDVNNEFVFLMYDDLIIQQARDPDYGSKEYPNFGCDWTQMKVTEHFLVVQCDELTYQIFDINASLYDSLYSTVAVESKSLLSVSIEEKDKFYLYLTSADTLETYFVGQTGDQYWSPDFPIDYTPQNSEVQTVWGLVSLKLNERKPEYSVTLTLEAITETDFKSCEIELSFLNIGQYISINTDYDHASSIFTNQGKLNVTNESFSGPIPEDAFKGNDVEYIFIVNSDTIIRSSNDCVDSSYHFCIENKSVSHLNFSDFDTAHDFLVSGSYIFISADYFIYVYRLMPNSAEKIITFNLNRISLFKTSEIFCSMVKSIQDFIVLLVCTEDSPSEPDVQYYSLTALDLNIDQVYFTHYTDFEIEVLQVAEIDESRKMIFLYEGSILYLYELTSSLTLTYLTTITELDLSVPSFSLLSVHYIDESCILLGDSESGLMRLMNTTNGYALLQTYEFEQREINSEESLLASVTLLSDKTTVLCVMTQGDVYKIAMNSTGFTLLSHFPPPFGLAETPIRTVPGVCEISKFIAFPLVYNSNSVVLRMLNYTKDVSDSIFQDKLLEVVWSDLDKSTGKIQFFECSSESVMVAHNLVKNEDETRPVTAYQVRKQPYAYVYGDRNISGSVHVKLSALNLFSIESFDPFVVDYGQGNHQPKIHHNDSGIPWWVWAVSSIGVAFLIFVAVLLKKKCGRRKARSNSESLYLFRDRVFSSE